MDGNPYWDDIGAPEGPPADHKIRRDALFAASRTIPIPDGAEEIEDTSTPADNTVIGPDGSEISYYTRSEGGRVIYATLAHPEGYAEFTLRNGVWTYLPGPVVLYGGYTSTYFDDFPATLVKLPPPTLEDATRQAR